MRRDYFRKPLLFHARVRGRDVVAAGFADELLSAELAQVVGGLPGGIAVLPGDLATLAACSATVNPPGAGVRASAADSAARIRGLSRSIPAVLPVSLWAGRGSSSSRPSGRNPMSAQSRVRPVLQAEDGADCRDVQPRAGPVQHPVEQGLHLRAGGEQQVAGVFGLVDRVAVAEPAALLLLKVQPEAQARRIDPPVTDLAQAPFSRLLLPVVRGVPRWSCV